MAERLNRKPSMALLSFGLGFATFVTIALASAEVRAFWLILCGLAMGAIAIEIIGTELKRYLSADAEPGALSGRIRLALTMGFLFGVAVMTVIIVAHGLDGAAALFFIVALLMGRHAAKGLRKGWKRWAAAESDPPEEDDDPESQADQASRVAAANDTTGKQLVNGLWLVLGFVLGAGVALGCAVVVGALFGG